jgi:enoyl-CoA hydratase
VSTAAATDVLFSVQAGIGRITLNRPKALNALTHDMIRAIDAQLVEWANDASVSLVLLDGTGERGLCAGGDIRALYEDAKAGRLQGPADFFRDEYRLNARIARYAKPFVVFMDGIVMGGGIGLASHAAHRVVTPRSMLAMPEVGIGFIPDVGGTFLLGHAPGELGTHAALTAGRLGAADAMLLGLADLCVAVDRLPALAASLKGLGDAGAIRVALEAQAEPPPPGVLAAARAWIDAAYAAGSVEQIIAALQARPEPDAQAAVREIAGKSPTSLKLALRLLRTARTLGRLELCLQQEYDAALICMVSHDFVEGVRAAVVDKDRNPRWSPASLAEVTPDRVDRYFLTSPDTDLHLT